MARSMMSDLKTKPAQHGLRITVTMEVPSEEMMEWALAQALLFARQRWYGVTVSHKDNSLARVSCRTTKMRKPKESR